MARHRSRSKKSSNDEPTSGSTSASESSSASARVLRTLPSAASTHRLARTPSKIIELLDHAHQHVELAMRLCEDGDNAGQSGDDEWPSMAATMHSPGDSLLYNGNSITSKARLVVRVLLRKKHRVLRLATKSAADDARYNRLKQGYAAVTQHLQDTDATREVLQDALSSFRKHAIAMESVLPPEPRDSRVMVTSLHACFAKTAGLVDDLVSTLAQDVAAQTQAKAEQLAAFKDTLDRRERLFIDTAIAKQQFQKLHIKQRSTIPGAYDLELAQLKHEHAVLRRRLACLTAAMEHVFQFHTHLDQCVVDPEMATVHQQLTRFFDKHARVFEKNVK